MPTINVSAGGSLQAAVNSASPGDTIVCLGNPLSERVNVLTNNLTIDFGGYTLNGNYTLPSGSPTPAASIATTCHGSQMSNPWSYAPLLDIRANNITVQNGTIRESVGRVIQIGDDIGTFTQLYDNINITNMNFTDSRSHLVWVGQASNVTFTDCDMKRGGTRLEHARGTSQLNHPVCVLVIAADSTSFYNCQIHENWGEGVSFGRGATNGLLEGCKVWDNYALQVYIHYTTGTIIRNCVIGWSRYNNSGALWTSGSDFLRTCTNKTAAIIFAHERGTASPSDRWGEKYPANNNITIEGNVIFGTEAGIIFRANQDYSTAQGGGTNLAKLGLVNIRNNTFLNPWNHDIDVSQNNTHILWATGMGADTNGPVNIYHNAFTSTATPLTSITQSNSNYIWNTNAWGNTQGQIPAQAQHGGDIYSANFQLVNPIDQYRRNQMSTIDVANYVPIIGSGSDLINKITSDAPPDALGVTRNQGGLGDIGALESNTTCDITAAFNYNIIANTNVQFNSTSSGADLDNISWDFGDSSGTSVATNPTYQYATAGTYTVCLTANGATGGSPPVEKIINGGLETNNSNWTAFGGTFSAVTPGANGTARGLRITSDGVSSSTQISQNSLSITSGTEYTASLWIQGNSTVRFKLIKHASPFTNLGLDETIALNGTWTYYTYTFNATDNESDARLQVFINNPSSPTQTFAIDEVSLLEGTIAPPSCPPAMTCQQVTVTDGNTVPILTTRNQNNTVSDIVTYQPVAVDGDGDILSWSFANLPPGLSGSNTTGLISGTCTTAGIYNSQVTVNDGNGGIATSNFTWTVQVRWTLTPSFNYVINGLQVQFNSTSTTNQTLEDWFWTFGDGDVTVIQHPSHTYSTGGTYIVCHSNHTREATPEGPELIIDGGLNASAVNWTSVNTQGALDFEAGQIGQAAVVKGNGSGNTHFYQDGISINAGQKYTLSFYMKGSVANPRVKIIDGLGQNVGVNGTITSLSLSRFKLYTYTFIATNPTNINDGRVQFSYLGTSLVDNKMVIDEVSLRTSSGQVGFNGGDTVCQTINVADNTSCGANGTLNGITINEGTTITVVNNTVFLDMSGSSSTGTFVDMIVDWGDGINQTFASFTASHTYVSSGTTYPITVTMNWV